MGGLETTRSYGGHTGTMPSAVLGNDYVDGWEGSDHLYGEAGGRRPASTLDRAMTALYGGGGNDYLDGAADDDVHLERRRRR